MKSVLNPSECNQLLLYEYGRGSPYEDELRLTTALSALVQEEEIRHPDHRLFQVAHLVTEYSWCHMHYELCRVIDHIDHDRYVGALRLLQRVTGVNEIALDGVGLLQKFLPQHSLLTMRNSLPADATGLDSPGHRNLRRAAKVLWGTFQRAMDREQVTLAYLIEAQNDSVSPDGMPAAHGMLALIREEMVRLDTSVHAWNQAHLRMVWSQLGGHPEAGRNGCTQEREPKDLPTSLGGRPISIMQESADLALFPALWQAAEDTYRVVTVPSPPRNEISS